MPDADPVMLRHRALEQIAMTALLAARVLMESGARAQVVHRCAEMVARGLGAEQAAVRSGYASVAITVGSGGNSITRMAEVGRHGVNHRLDQAVRILAVRAAAGGMGPAELRGEIERLCRQIPRHPPWLVALAVGLGCAAFGRLLGVDWAGCAATLAAAAIGQGLRHHLLAHRLNGFVVAALIAFVAAGLGGAGARLLDSGTVYLALMASVLLLVPGVPALNAQIDIMEGSPTLGSARAVSVAMVMVFVTVGLWLARVVVGWLP